MAGLVVPANPGESGGALQTAAYCWSIQPRHHVRRRALGVPVAGGVHWFWMGSHADDDKLVGCRYAHQMKFFPPHLVLPLALVAASSNAAAPDPSLTGCWRAAKIVQHFQDGSQAEDSSGRCMLRFQEDQLESSCATANGSVSTTYRYRIERAHFYLATMAGSTFATSLIGSTREYEYRVEGNRLFTATNLQVTQPAAPTAMVRVETEAARMPCPTSTTS